MLYLGMAVLAALAFTVGGVFMKLSQGFTQPCPRWSCWLCSRSAPR